MKFVFVSYAPQDADLAGAVIDRLRALLAPRDVEVRSDPDMTPRRIFPEWVDDHIVAAERVLVLWSAASRTNPYVQGEAEKARSLAKYVACLIDPDLARRDEFGAPFNGFHTPLVVTPDLGSPTRGLIVDDAEIDALAEELSKPPTVPSPEVVEIGAVSTPAESADREELLSNVDPWAPPGGKEAEDGGSPRLRTLYVDGLARLATHGDPAVRDAVATYFKSNLGSHDDALGMLAEAAARINSPALWDDIGAVIFPRRPSDAIGAWRKAGLRDEEIAARLGLAKPATGAVETLDGEEAHAEPATAPPAPAPAAAPTPAREEPKPPGDDRDERGADDGAARRRAKAGAAAWFLAGAAAAVVGAAGAAGAAYLFWPPLQPWLAAKLGAQPAPSGAAPAADAEATAESTSGAPATCLDAALFNASSLGDQREALSRCGLALREPATPAWCPNPDAFDRLMRNSGDPDEALRACGLALSRLEPPAGCADAAAFERLYRAGDYVGAFAACEVELVATSAAEAAPQASLCPDPAIFNGLSRTTQIEQLRTCGLVLADAAPPPVNPETGLGDSAAGRPCSPEQGPPCRVTLDGATTLNELAQTYYQERRAWCWIYETNPEVFDGLNRPPLVRNDPNCIYSGDTFELTPLPTGWRYQTDCAHRELIADACPRDADVGRAAAAP